MWCGCIILHCKSTYHLSFLATMQPFQSFQDFISHIDVPTSLYETFNRHSSVQIDVNSTDREVRRAYRQAAAALHPDNTQSQNDVELFYKLSEARDILCDTSKRERYNTELRKARATYEDEIAKATVLYEVEKAKHFDQEQKRKKDERKAAKRSPGGNNKKKKTRGKHFESLLVAYLFCCH